jgi:hypothetical protein
MVKAIPRHEEMEGREGAVTDTQITVEELNQLEEDCVRIADYHRDNNTTITMGLGEVRKLIAAARATWRDIATAPKDGTEILVWDGDTVEKAVWVNGWAASWNHEPLDIFPVTHWQPLPPPPRVSQGEEDDKARTEIQTEGAVPASGNVEGDNRPSTLTAEEQAIVRNTLRENNARARAEAKRQGVTRRVAPLPAQGEEDVRPASLSNSDPVIDSGRDDGSLVATPTLQAIGGLVERLRTINTQGPIYALCDEAADALLTMESIAVVDKATISAALKANAALQERAELCEGFELRHRQQIDVLLGENRIKEIAIEQISAERDNHESVAKNNYRIVCELTDELGKAKDRIKELEEKLRC